MLERLLICIPGPWADENDFVECLAAASQGQYIYEEGWLIDLLAHDQVALDLEDFTPTMVQAFELGAQDEFDAATLAAVNSHESVAYLHFPTNILKQRERLDKFTKVVADAGGIAVKVESTGLCHSWDSWFALIGSDDLFDTYCACILLLDGGDVYYSCGMHLFELADAEVPASLDIDDAADLIHEFNYYRIAENPVLADGQTFAAGEAAPVYRLRLLPETRYADDDYFHNEHGIWQLTSV